MFLLWLKMAYSHYKVHGIVHDIGVLPLLLLLLLLIVFGYLFTALYLLGALGGGFNPTQNGWRPHKVLKQLLVGEGVAGTWLMCTIKFCVYFFIWELSCLWPLTWWPPSETLLQIQAWMQKKQGRKAIYLVSTLASHLVNNCVIVCVFWQRLHWVTLYQTLQASGMC